MPFISGGGSGGGLPGVTVSGTPAASQALIATSAAAAAWAYPPGFEIGYTQITSSVNITDTSEATATALISPGALTFDGGAVLFEFFSPFVQSPNGAAGQSVTLTLFEGATQLTRLSLHACLTNGVNHTIPVAVRYRFTPSAASHTYKLCGFVTSTTGTPLIGAGTPGTGAYAPAYVRFTKV